MSDEMKINSFDPSGSWLKCSRLTGLDRGFFPHIDLNKDMSDDPRYVESLRQFNIINAYEKA